MGPDRVRIDYEILFQIAQVFAQQSEAVRKTLERLRQALSTLQEGDWVGKGADKFYTELTSAVLPAVQRLEAALENAAQVTKKIIEVMKQAEEAAARVLNGSGAGGTSSAGGAGGAAAGEAGGTAGGASGGESAGGTAGGAAGGAPAGGAAGGAAGADAGANQQTEAEATEARLNENGITIQSSGNCRDRTNSSCTSVDGMRQATVDGIIAFREAVGVDLVITGGTEVGHAGGQHSHAHGYKVDIRLDDTVNQYIENNFEHVGQRGDGAELYRDANGNTFAREGNHWDITFE